MQRRRSLYEVFRRIATKNAHPQGNEPCQKSLNEAEAPHCKRFSNKAETRQSQGKLTFEISQII
jgi:hypothetical protein